MSDDSANPGDPAKARFLIIQAVRLGGFALTALGMLGVAGKIALPQIAGLVIAGAGLTTALIVPAALLRKWKSPQP